MAMLGASPPFGRWAARRSRSYVRVCRWYERSASRTSGCRGRGQGVESIIQSACVCPDATRAASFLARPSLSRLFSARSRANWVAAHPGLDAPERDDGQSGRFIAQVPLVRRQSIRWE